MWSVVEVVLVVKSTGSGHGVSALEFGRLLVRTGAVSHCRCCDALRLVRYVAFEQAQGEVRPGGMSKQGATRGAERGLRKCTVDVYEEVVSLGTEGLKVVHQLLGKLLAVDLLIIPP